MKEIFRKWLTNYNSFSKGDRNAIIILGTLIFILLIADVVVNNIHPESKNDFSRFDRLLKDLESGKNNKPLKSKTLFRFDPNSASTEILDSLDIPEFVKHNLLNYRNSGGWFSSPDDVKKIYGMNDSIFKRIEDYITISPGKDLKADRVIHKELAINGFINLNKADFNQLKEFGFGSFQAGNIIEYRKKGGSFKSVNDLLKIYGIDSAFYDLVKDHILIELDEKPGSGNKIETVKVELNSADSTELLKLNGIGPVYASRIIKYRELLGGFYSVNQILEVYNFPEETFKNIEGNISADTMLVKKIRINFADFKEFVRNPYLNRKQIESIIKYRDKNGAFQNITQLKTSGLIDPETFSKLKPYLTCR